MEIIINDTPAVVSQAEDLTSASIEIDSARESLEFILNEIKQYWEQTQQDAMSFSKGLEENIQSLQTIVECNKEFANSITVYAQTQEKTSQQAV